MAQKKQRVAVGSRGRQAVKTRPRQARTAQPQSRSTAVRRKVKRKINQTVRLSGRSRLRTIVEAIASPRIKKRQGAFLAMGLGSFSFLLGMGYGWSGQLLSSVSQASNRHDAHGEPLSNLTRLPPSAPAAQTLPSATVDTISIKAVGDIVPGTNFPRDRLPPRKEALFQHVQPLLQDADVVFGNLESTLTNYPYTSKNLKSEAVFAFRTPPEYAQLLKAVGFDVLSIANNHAFDFGQRGFQDTVQNIEKAGMKAVGKKGQILYTQVRDTKLAWIGFSYFNDFNSINHSESAVALIEQATQNADLVVISVHAGAEGTSAMAVRDRTEYFHGENRGNLARFSREAIDRGADLILGHGPHVPRALELYKGKLIAYSLGNFAGYRTLSTQDQLALSLVLEVSLDRQGNFLSGRILPVYIKKPGIPYPSPQADSIKLIRYLTQRDLPQTPLAIADDGTILKK